MKYFLLRSLKLCCQTDVVFARIGVSEVVRIVAAGDLNADAMLTSKNIASRSPEINRVFIGLIRFDNTKFAGVEGATAPGIAVAGSDNTLTQEQGSSVGVPEGSGFLHGGNLQH